MPKYEVTHDGGDLRYGVQADDEHVVGGPFVSYSAAEAHIIAWALNRVTEGSFLYAFTEGSPVAYDGPTNGVAPLDKESTDG